MPEGIDRSDTDRTQAGSLSALIGQLEPNTARILDKALAAEDISVEEAVVLFETTGAEFAALGMVADELPPPHGGRPSYLCRQPQH